MTRPPQPEDPHGDWPDRLLRDLAKAPYLEEKYLDAYRGGDVHRQTLSSAEKRVLTGASHGLTIEMIADTYGLSSETVKSQLKTARFVLRAKNTQHAVALALRQKQIN